MKTWTTKDGRVIPLTELSDKHLTNIVLMLRRKVDAAWHEYDSAVGASAFNGDMASYYADQETTFCFDQVSLARLRLGPLEEEAERRGILESRIDPIEDRQISARLRAQKVT